MKKTIKRVIGMLLMAFYTDGLLMLIYKQPFWCEPGGGIQLTDCLMHGIVLRRMADSASMSDIIIWILFASIFTALFYAFIRLLTWLIK